MVLWDKIESFLKQTPVIYFIKQQRTTGNAHVWEGKLMIDINKFYIQKFMEHLAEKGIDPASYGKDDYHKEKNAWLKANEEAIWKAYEIADAELTVKK